MFSAESVKKIGMTLDPGKEKEREAKIKQAIKNYDISFGSLDMEKSYKPLFELLWYSQMPCFDVKGITSSAKDELSFIKRCYWKNKPISCAAIFQKRPTDRGMCCTFNMQKAEQILTSSKYTEAIALRQVDEAKMGFEDANLPPYYIKNREPVPEPGREKGLTIVVDRHSDKLSRGTVTDNFQGFVTIVDDNSKYPMASVNSLIAIPGYENYVKVKAIHMEGKREIQNYSPKERNCYFAEEFKLDMHQHYSQSNCLLECKIKFASKSIPSVLQGHI